MHFTRVCPLVRVGFVSRNGNVDRAAAKDDPIANAPPGGSGPTYGSSVFAGCQKTSIASTNMPGARILRPLLVQRSFYSEAQQSEEDRQNNPRC